MGIDIRVLYIVLEPETEQLHVHYMIVLCITGADSLLCPGGIVN